MKIKRFIGGILAAFTLALGVGVGLASSPKEVKEAKATDYSSTIRVYFDLGWGNIDYVRIGTDQESGNASLTSSDAKYNQSLGKYVRDVSSSDAKETMQLYFSQSSTWWWVIDGDTHGSQSFSGGWQPGKEYQVKSIAHKSDWGDGTKCFTCAVYEIGDITDNANNATVYFVDGYSWHTNARAYIWGGTATCASYPGDTMDDSGLRLGAWVGEMFVDNLVINKYTIKGSAAYIKFANADNPDWDGHHTGDLRLTDGAVYYMGVNAEVFGPVVNLLLSLQSDMGSYSFEGKTFSNSICSLITNGKAQNFINTYDDLYENHGSGVQSSVLVSAVYTYSQPTVDNTTKGYVSLSEVHRALLEKDSNLTTTVSRGIAGLINTSDSSLIIVITVSVALLAAAGGYFFFRKRKED